MSPEPDHHDNSHHGNSHHPEDIDYNKVSDPNKSIKDYTHFGIPKPAIESKGYSVFERSRQKLYGFVDRPVRWIRESWIEPLQAKNQQPYYHRRYARVPTIDECREGDLACYFEADEQYKRDKEVDAEILKIIRKRKNDCILYEREDWAKNCVDAMEEYENSATNFFLRYGEVGHFSTCIDVYMRQKHRMIWERRHPEKVDFMYAKERQGRKYIRPVRPGLVESANFPDNSRAALFRDKPVGTGGFLVNDPESPQDASRHYGKEYNTKDSQGKFAP